MPRVGLGASIISAGVFSPSLIALQIEAALVMNFNESINRTVWVN
jgi:hypothetical protein